MPRGNEPTTKFKADISELKAAMQEASRQIRLANSEFKAASAGMDDWSDSADGLSAKLKQLDSVLDAQKSKLSSLEKQYELTAKEFGENSKGAQELAVKINNQKAAITKTEKSIQSYSGKLDKVKNGTKTYDEALEDLRATTDRASDGFSAMKVALGNLIADGIRKAITAVKDLAKETLQVGMEFEKSMSNVQAISGATAEDMQKLGDKAEEMGRKTKFSASEAADAFSYMAMAGWKTEDMLGGIEGIMNLAAASGEDLATTSDIVTNALTAMGYSAKDAGKLADVMAAASSNSNTNVKMMGQTFQYAAPIVGALGYNMEDTAKAIGLMGNAGIQADKAGTALRSMLTRLSAPPKECAEEMEKLGISITDSNGKMKDLDTVMKDLRQAFGKLSETEKTAAAKHLAGQEAMSGLLAIVQAAPEDYDKLTKAVENSNGAAQNMADTMNDNVAGKLQAFRSKVEGAMITVYKAISENLKKGIEEAGNAIDGINWDAVGKKVGDFAQKIIDLFTWILRNGNTVKNVILGIIAAFAIAKLVKIVGTIVGMVQTMMALRTAIMAATTAQEVLNAVQLASPWGAIGAALGIVVGLVVALSLENEKAAKKTGELNESQKTLINSVNSLKDSYNNLKTARDENVAKAQSEFGYYTELKNELDSIVDKNGKVKKGYEERAKFIVTTLNQALGLEMELNNGVIKNYRDQKKAIEDLLVTKRAEAVLRANEGMYNEALQNRTQAFKNMNAAQKEYGKVSKEAKAAEDNLIKAQKEFNETVKYTTSPAGLGAATKKLKEAQDAYDASAGKQKKLKKAWEDSKTTYEGYITTITNYEGVSSKVIGGDVKKIQKELIKLENGFITAENGTRKSLTKQVKNYETMLADYKEAIKKGTPGITSESVKQMETLVKEAKKELAKLPPEAKKEGEKTGKQFSDGVSSKKEDAKTAGKGVAESAKSGTGEVSAEKSGENFSQGFINGIKSLAGSVWEAAKALAKKAWDGLRKGQEEGSPSKLTYRSGVNFVKGYINGIISQQNNLVKTVQNLIGAVTKELLKLDNFNFSEVGSNASSQFAETIASKIEYINNRASYKNQQKIDKLNDEITKNEEKRDKETTKAENKRDKQVTAAEKARDRRVTQLEKERDQAIKATEKQRDKTVKSLEKERDKRVKELEKQLNNAKTKAQKDKIKTQIKNVKAQYNEDIKTEKEAAKKKIAGLKDNAKKDIKAVKENAKNEISVIKSTAKEKLKEIETTYGKLISEQEEFRDAYQEASAAMLSELSKTLSEYQQSAQNLIDTTINGITSKYDQKYNDLLQKQDTLISKLKGMGNLLDVSGAGVGTVNDLKEQTKQIKEYADKLKKVKEKVSADLFDEIAQMDVKEGRFFMDQLLSMSDADLKAYVEAYEEKMKVAESLSESLYENDFKNIADEYAEEIKNAMAKLPDLLEELGRESMEGFLEGLTVNTDYMTSQVRTFINGMIDTFKKQLNLSVNVNGRTIGTDLTDLTANIMSAKQAVNTNTDSGYVGGQTINNYYDLVQNNTSPKSLSALDTYRARRQQIALIKAFT